MNYTAPAPAYWKPEYVGMPGCELTDETCVLGGEHFLVRGRIEIPVLDGDGEVFSWGVWVSLSAPNFARAMELWDTPGREAEPPYFGWLSTELPGYTPGTLLLKTNVHTRRVGQRPLVEVEPTEHPLAVEQRTGITLARVREIGVGGWGGTCDPDG